MLVVFFYSFVTKNTNCLLCHGPPIFFWWSLHNTSLGLTWWWYILFFKIKTSAFRPCWKLFLFIPGFYFIHFGFFHFVCQNYPELLQRYHNSLIFFIPVCHSLLFWFELNCVILYILPIAFVFNNHNVWCFQITFVENHIEHAHFKNCVKFTLAKKSCGTKSLTYIDI